MKRKGSHPDRALNALAIKAFTRPGRYADGNGLYLVVDPLGAKRWMLRTVVQGRRRDIGLGSLSLVSLADAREKAAAMRRAARDGSDPVAERRAASRRMPTFADAAKRVHADHEKAWKNRKHAAQWLTTLEVYAFPVFGSRAIDQVTTADVLRALSPIWLVKPETARRVRQRIGAVLDWAKAAGFRTGDNPVQGVTKGLPRQTDKPEHHAAVPYLQTPAFLRRLGEQAPTAARRALEFLILTGGRTSEVVEARWSEFDLEAGLWTVPADRMKAKREHRVPLSQRALDLLRHQILLDACGVSFQRSSSVAVFCGPTPTKRGSSGFSSFTREINSRPRADIASISSGFPCSSS